MPKLNKVKIEKWLRCPFDQDKENIQTVEDLLDWAGRRLDAAYADEICGEVLFEGKDGKIYTGSVEFCVSEANPEYVKDVTKENCE